MSIRTVVVVALALVCGLSAAWGMNQLRGSSIIKVEPETTPVAVARIDISRGQTVAEEDVKIQQWPKHIVPEGAFTTLEDVVDRPAIVPMVAGEAVLQAKLAASDAGRGLAALIPTGMRAYAIQVSREASSVAGFILPGNKVDVLLTLKGRYNDETGGGSTTTLLQAVEIMAIDQKLDAPAENKVDTDGLKSVTLLVTPEQASLLDLGQHMGRLTLSLRNPQDNDEAQTRPATLADIRFRQEGPIPEPGDETDGTQAPRPGSSGQRKEPQNYYILTLRGGSRGQVRVTAND